MPGPMRKPESQRVRPHSSSPLTQLPAEGRKGPLPAWPFSAQTVREHMYWRELWEMPQAVAWERLGCLREVALYCRLAIEAEDGDLRAGKDMVSLGDRLGCTPMAMTKLRWEIAPDQIAQRRAENTSPAPKLKRISAVDSAAG